MKLRELADLISTRDYVVFATDNFSLDKETNRYMDDVKLLVDRKIVDLLKSDEFKDYIGYDGIQEARLDAAKATSEVFVKAREKMASERGFK